MNFESDSPLYNLNPLEDELYNKYDCLVLVVNDNLIEYYNNKKLCVSEHSKSKQPFIVVRNAINMFNPTGFYCMSDNKYLKNVHVKIYSCKLLNYLYDFNINESQLEYEFFVDFDKMSTVENYTEGSFTYESGSGKGYLIKKDDKNYVQMYSSSSLSCISSSYICISNIILY